jgi:purine nucleoside phosphorylase
MEQLLRKLRTKHAIGFIGGSGLVKLTSQLSAIASLEEGTERNSACAT